MAFDQPIEADRIDDFNLFSAFVRAPLWILGGVLGGNASRNQEKDEEIKIRRLDEDDCENDPPGSNTNGPLKKRIVSDYDLASKDGSSDDYSYHVWPNNSLCGTRGSSRIDETAGLQRTKNLSWSDETGKSLVEYNDESAPHEPSPYSSVTSTSAPKPMKSAMRRSRSIRSEADGMGSAPEQTRYIPKMTAAKNGLIIPTRPFGPDGTSNGMESPQLGYGFYLNITPPTPEMYHSHASRNARGITGPAMPANPSTSSIPVGRSIHNQVFQNLQNNQAPMGWTSVPI